MKKKNNIYFSIIIANYNNCKLIERCIRSINNQTYKNFEIIFVDDKSKDNSISFVKNISKNIKKIKVIQKNRKKNIPAYDQIETYMLGIKNSKGKYICFLDSDDFFNKKKLFHIKNFFIKNKQTKIVYDYPIVYFNKKKLYKKRILSRKINYTPWPRFSPQSCITGERKYLNKIIKNIKILKFPTIWLDFRISLQASIDMKKIIFLKKYLTFYQQSNDSASKNYKTFSKNWWIRRNEAHKFAKYLLKKNNKKYPENFDNVITNIVNSFIK